MADKPPVTLKFSNSSPDPGKRTVDLPKPLPGIGNDFDWTARDFTGFRDFMLQELMTRFPQRKRWTAADVEVTIIEALAAALDGLSDMADRALSEGFLQSAQKQESLYRWLRLIGYDGFADEGGNQLSKEEIFKRWNNRFLMEHDRLAAPAHLTVQQRMVSLADIKRTIESHPLVIQADVIVAGNGLRPAIMVAVCGWNDMKLDDHVKFDSVGTNKQQTIDYMKEKIETYHSKNGIYLPSLDMKPTMRRLLEFVVDKYRIAGQRIFLSDALKASIDLSFTVHLEHTYFRSEIRTEIVRVLGRGPTGFFRRGGLGLGQDLRLGDIYQQLTAIDGVIHVDVKRFGRSGDRYADCTSQGFVPVASDEYAVCDNDPDHKENGSLTIDFTGGRSA